MVERREVWVSIVLTIVTCGLYGLYWYYMLADDLYKLNKEPSRAGIDVIITIVTCGLYGIYMMYKFGDMEEQIRRNRGTRSKDNRILYLFLSLFGLSIINGAIIQSNINDEFLGHIDMRDNQNQW